MNVSNPTCQTCNNISNKNGKTANGKQRYHCKDCNKSFLFDYSYNAYSATINNQLQILLIEGCGIRSISRILKISLTTVLKRIRIIAAAIKKPIIVLGKEYELDELCTFVKKKTRLLWIVYAIRKDTKQVIDFAIGSRTNNTLKNVIDTLLLSEASKVCTDKLKQYEYLLPKKIHCFKQYGTNHIERKNLNLRTHLKRLNRRTICFSKNKIILAACLKIYFWQSISLQKQ